MNSENLETFNLKSYGRIVDELIPYVEADHIMDTNNLLLAEAKMVLSTIKKGGGDNHGGQGD